MRVNCGIFSNNVKVLGSAALMGALLVINGCGGGDSAPVVASAATQVTASQAIMNPAGTVTTTTSVTAKDADADVAITIPAGTTITAKDAAGNTLPFAALPVIVVSTPVSGVSGMPQPKTVGLTISGTAGALDVTIGGANSVTFSQPITIAIDIVDPSKLTTNTVYMNKNDGNGWKAIGTAAINAARTVGTIQVTNLCWFSIDDVFTTGTGSTGGTGNGSNF